MIYNISPFAKESCYNVWYTEGEGINQIIDIETLNVPVESQETILTSYNLSTVNDPLLYLKRLYSFLKPGGELWIYEYDWEIIARKYLGSELTCGQMNLMFGHTRRMVDRNHIVEIMQQAGFKEFVEFYDKNKYYQEKGENELIIKAKK